LLGVHVKIWVWPPSPSRQRFHLPEWVRELELFLGGAVFFLPKLVMPRGTGMGRGADWGACFKDRPPLVGEGVGILGAWSKLCVGAFRVFNGDGFP
jgi:hypothetical protein